MDPGAWCHERVVIADCAHPILNSYMVKVFELCLPDVIEVVPNVGRVGYCCALKPDSAICSSLYCRPKQRDYCIGCNRCDEARLPHT